MELSKPAIVTPPQKLMTARSVDDPFFTKAAASPQWKAPASVGAPTGAKLKHFQTLYTARILSGSQTNYP